MIKEVDCRGLECPKPVIETKKAIEAANGDIIVAIVDNAIARDNVKRLAESMKLTAEVREVEGNFQISINTATCTECAEAEAIINGVCSDEYVILVKGNTLGFGDDELGNVLIKSFMFTVANHDKAPKKMMFLNGGVKLTVNDSPVLENLKVLADKGVEIISCGTCLDFYKLKEELAVGRVGNMYDIFDSCVGVHCISI